MIAKYFVKVCYDEILLNLREGNFQIRDIVKAADVCDISLFTKEEIVDPYGAPSRALQKYTELDSVKIIQAIVINSKISTYDRKPCLEKSVQCHGGNKGWSFSKQALLDNF